MTIDINLLRVERGGDPQEVRDSEKRRFRDPAVVDEVIAADSEWREAIYQMEQAKKEVNAVNKSIGQLKKKSASATAEDKAEEEKLMKRSAELKETMPRLEKKAFGSESRRDTLIRKIGNIVHRTVPISNDEENNAVVRTWGVPRRIEIDGKTPGRLHHHEILARLCGYEPKKGVEIAGHRGYYLRGPGVMLNMALIQYGLSFLTRRRYVPIQPPFFMRREVMKETAELKDFEETLYRIPMGSGGTAGGGGGGESGAVSDQSSSNKAASCSNNDAAGGAGSSQAPNHRQTDCQQNYQEGNKDDLFLIATSEQPISALHRGENVEEKELPLRYAGTSTCFRKEAGSHGKDTWGIFRVHQFEKIEQFCITSPEKSWEMHDEMIATAEEFYQTLGLPYRVVAIVSGALNDAAAKKFDLEAFFPGYADYRELVSCSNCTDFQSRDLEIRLGHKKTGEREKKHVHMLNGTLVATQRCLCCILENYQTEHGVKVPHSLVPFMGGVEFLSYPQTAATSAASTASATATTTTTTPTTTTTVTPVGTKAAAAAAAAQP